MPTLVRRTHLALRARGDLRPPTREPMLAGVRLLARTPCTVAEYRALYRLVGERWRWRDRLAWSDARLAAWLARDDVRLCVLEVEGEPAGFYELHRGPAGGVEIVYFGLAEGVTGRGLGGWLLVRAVADAWDMGARWVGLNTCTLDAPAALPNYRARGFVPYRTDEYLVP